MSFPSLQSHLKDSTKHQVNKFSSGDTQAPEKMGHPSMWFVSMTGDLRNPVLCLVDRLCPTLCNPMDCSLPDSSIHGNSPGKNTGVGCHALLQEGALRQNFWNWSSTADSKMSACLLVTSVMSNSLRLYRLYLPVSSFHGVLQARILEWVAISYSRGSSQPRVQTWVSCVSCIGRWVPLFFLESSFLISFFFLSFIFISWRLITLQYCSGFLPYIDMNQP